MGEPDAIRVLDPCDPNMLPRLCYELWKESPLGGPERLPRSLHLDEAISGPFSGFSVEAYDVVRMGLGSLREDRYPVAGRRHLSKSFRIFGPQRLQNCEAFW